MQNLREGNQAPPPPPTPALVDFSDALLTRVLSILPNGSGVGLP